jgi:CRP/FNR family transcriptional regulator
VDEKLEVLRKTALFGELDAAALSELASRMSERRLDRNAILFVENEPSEGMFVLAEGAVRAFRSGLDGREQIIHVEKAVATLAEVTVFDDGNYPSTVAGEEQSRLFFIPKTDVISISLAHPQVALAGTRLLAARLRRCAELVETLSLREVGQRIAKVFLQEAIARGTPSANGASFAQTLTHSQLATRIGTVREVVSRSLARLEAAGLITISGKKIQVHDLDALKNYADR